MPQNQAQEQSMGHRSGASFGWAGCLRALTHANAPNRTEPLEPQAPQESRSEHIRHDKTIREVLTFNESLHNPAQRRTTGTG